MSHRYDHDPEDPLNGRRYADPDEEEAPRPVRAKQRRQKADEARRKLQDAGSDLRPVLPNGREIAKSFWGRSWCLNLNRYHDYESRMPSGRSYLRSGNVLDLRVLPGQVSARVQGSRLYDVEVKIAAVDPEHWEALKQRCAGHIDSIVALLAGELPVAVMSAVTDTETGLFPEPGEIRFSCTCPDSADMCKHVAASLYGVGARLDDEPDLIFLMRGVQASELMRSATSEIANLTSNIGTSDLADQDLSDIFGIDFDGQDSQPD